MLEWSLPFAETHFLVFRIWAKGLPGDGSGHVEIFVESLQCEYQVILRNETQKKLFAFMLRRAYVSLLGHRKQLEEHGNKALSLREN